MSTLVLDSTTKTIKVNMSGAAATTNPDYIVSYADNNGTTFTEGALDGALNGVTDVTVVSAPASSTRRIVKSIYIENKDTAAVTITVKYDNNATQRTIVKVTLAVGDTWSTDGAYDTNGALKQTLGTVNLASGVTGTLPIANGGTGATTLASASITTYTGTETLTNKTLTAPIISSISNTGTLTLPTSTDTLVGRATTDTLTNKSIVATQLSGTIAAARLPAGSVLQVIQATDSTSRSTSSSSWVTVSNTLTVTITPNFSTSKILILSSMAVNQTASNGDVYFTIFRNGSTNLGNSTSGFFAIYTNAVYTNPFRVSGSVSYLDSPATTSATTYQLYMQTNGTGNAGLNNESQVSTITVMEIAA